MRPASFILLSLMANAPPAPRASDLRDYALAACLTKQNASPALREEGYHLASIVLYRADVSPFAWLSLERAVETGLNHMGLLMVHTDGPVAQSTRPAPLASCLRVIDSRPVRQAMAKLAVKRR